MQSTKLKGKIIKSLAGFYYVEAGNLIFECKARGSFRHVKESPLTGDNVEISVLNDRQGVIEGIIERKNSLIRPPLANVDRLYIVVSVNDPRPNFLVIDKLIAIAEDKGIEPVIVVNKTDLGDESDIIDTYSSAGFDVYSVCCKTGEGFDKIKDSFCDGINAFTGNSGVGKSSILNGILPELCLPTAQISEKLGRGRHTTRHTELFKVNGALIADTAGFSSLDIAKCENVNKDQLQYCFREFDEYISNCKFTGCAHVKDAGCKVREAVEGGFIKQSRYESYCSLYNDIKDIKEWEN